jgi:hypothetical protein
MVMKPLGLLLAGLVAGACGHAQVTGSARNGWVTPTGYASATDPANIDPKTGVDRNTAARHHGTYDNRFNTAVTAPSDFGSTPPPALSAPGTRM